MEDVVMKDEQGVYTINDNFNRNNNNGNFNIDNIDIDEICNNLKENKEEIEKNSKSLFNEDDRIILRKYVQKEKEMLEKNNYNKHYKKDLLEIQNNLNKIPINNIIKEKYLNALNKKKNKIKKQENKNPKKN